ncbi:MAG: hypothetical protein D6722_18705 [Bacteroidetes bacterium]|nr:MAG: hypothetical protein D6722_18705 [Bacteroidota bacterium]
MSNREHIFTLLEAYAAGDLSPAEAERVQQQLRQDPAYAEVWQELEVLQQGVQAYGRAQVRARIRTLVQQESLPARTRPLWQRPSVWTGVAALAAVIALLIWVGPMGWVGPYAGSESTFEVAPRADEKSLSGSQSAEAEDSSLQERAQEALAGPLETVDGTSRSVVPMPGLRAFEAGDDAAVIRILADQQGKMTSLQQLILAVSYLRTGEIALGKQLLADPDLAERYPVPVAWYQSLALLLQGETEAARQALEQIDAQQPPHPLRARARALLAHFPPLEFGE